MCMWHVGPDVFNDLFGSNPSREAFEAPVIPQQETLSPERPWLYVHQWWQQEIVMVIWRRN